MKKYKLVVVDDEYFIRDGLMSYNWEELGFEAVYAAEDGIDALNYIESNRVDVLLTDICIPNLNGISLCEYVKNNYPKCKLVILSGYRDFEYAQSAIRVGITDYLLKPVDFNDLNELFNKIKTYLDSNQESDSEIINTLDRIKRAEGYIKRNYHEDLSLDMVAAELDLSPAYFCSIFRKSKNIGFSEYLNDIRIDKAKNLLLQLNLKVYEISEMVGYRNPKYFTDIFKKSTGMSPLNYRKSKIA